MTEKTHYDVLGVSRDADPDVIRAAYGVLSRKYSQGQKGAAIFASILAKINTAHDVLSDPESRASYDEMLDGFERQNNAPALPQPSQPSNKIKTEKHVNLAWRRFFARSFDVMWESWAVFLALGVILSNYPNLNSKNILILYFFSLPLILIIDAIVLDVFKNTPGKYLLGLSLQMKYGKAEVSDYLQRNFELWIKGYCLGIPVLSQFAMAYQGDRLLKGRKATYDESSKIQIVAVSVGFIRKLLFTVLFLILLAITSFVNQISDQKHEVKAAETPTPSANKVDWDNGVITAPTQQFGGYGPNDKLVDTASTMASPQQLTENQPAEIYQQPAVQGSGEIDKYLNEKQPPRSDARGAENAVEAEHYRKIYAAHPDADLIVQSTVFQEWMGQPNNDSRRRDQEVLQRGSADQIIDLFNRFKQWQSSRVASGAQDSVPSVNGTLPQCKFKAIMTNDDYRACNRAPPGSN